MTSARRVVFALGLGLAFSVTFVAQAEATEPPVKWEAWFEVGGYAGTDDRNRGETNVFVPLLQETDWLLFLQGQGKFFEDDVQEGSVSLGFRKMMEDLDYGLGGWNVGLWGGWDVRHTDEENTFHQFSLGVEGMTEVFDVRVNGYVPGTGPRSSPGLARITTSGSRIVMVGGEEVPLDGVDGEVGVRVLHTTMFDREQALRLYAGGFYFNDDDAVDEIAGPRVRAEWRIHDVIPGFAGSELGVEAEFTHDDLRDELFELGLRLRIPLGRVKTARADLTPRERRMTEAIVRDVDIVTQRSDEEGVFDFLTKTPLNHLVVVDPGDDLQQEIDDAGPRSLIVVRGGSRNGQFFVGSDRTLLGGSSRIWVRGESSRTSQGYRAPGTKPILEYLNNGPVVTLSSGTHVAGLSIRGAGMGSGFGANQGIFGSSGISWSAATSNMIRDMGGTGIDYSSNSQHLNAHDNMVRNTGGNGIDFDSNSRNIKANHNTVENTGGNGLDFDSNSRNLVANHNWIMDTGGNGLDFDSSSRNMTANYNWIQNTGGNGLDFDSSSNDMWAIRNTIDTTGGNGLDFDNSSNNMWAIRNTISNTSGHGLDFDSSSNNMWAIGNIISDTTGRGLDFDSNSSNMTASRNRLTNISNDRAIDFDANSTNVTVTDNVIRNAADVYLDFDNNTTGLVVTGNILINDGDGSRAIDFDSNATGTFAGNHFQGDFGGDIIRFNGSGNAVTGGQNVLDATFGGLFCNDLGGGNGNSRIGFTNGTFCP